MSKNRKRKHSVVRLVTYRVVVAPGERKWNKVRRRYENNESRCEAVLEAAKRAGVIVQWDGSRGFFWWEGAPGPAMRGLRNEIGGESVRDDTIENAARRVGNAAIAPVTKR